MWRHSPARFSRCTCALFKWYAALTAPGDCASIHAVFLLQVPAPDRKRLLHLLDTWEIERTFSRELTGSLRQAIARESTPSSKVYREPVVRVPRVPASLGG